MQELGPDTLAVDILKSVDNFPQSERLFLPSNKSCLGKLEHRVKVLTMSYVTKAETIKKF